MLYGPPGLGKCVTKDTLLFTEDGICEIGALEPKKRSVRSGFSQLRLRVFGNPAPAMTSHYYRNGSSITRRITTRRGYRLEGTLNHPLVTLTSEGKKAFRTLEEIQPGDYVAIQRGQQFFGATKPFAPFTFMPKAMNHYRYANALPREMSPKLARLLGYLVGDGYIGAAGNKSATTVSFTNTNQEILRNFCQLWEQLFGQSLRPVIQPNRAPTVFAGNAYIRAFLLHIGLAYATAKNKEIPSSIFRANKECVREFLRAYFECDGHIRPNCRQMEISSASEKLLRQTHIILLNFGVVSRIYPDHHKKEGRTYWRLSITGGDVEIFLREVGFLSSRKHSALDNFQAKKNTNKDLVPFAKDHIREIKRELVKLNALLDQKAYRRHTSQEASQDEVARCLNTIERSLEAIAPTVNELRDISSPWIFWDQVAETESGFAETVDITVPKGRTFFSNGFISHKTSLAHLIAREVNSNIRITSGPAIERVGDLASILTNLLPGDVLFIDEAHRMNKMIEEVLYPAMESRTLDIIIGKGPSARTIQLELPPFTLIAATTRVGMLSGPLRSRFGVTFRLNFYSKENIERILARSCSILNIKADPEAIEIAAVSSRFTPRIANRLLKRVRDYAEVHGNGRVTAADAREAMRLLEIDELGLEPTDRRILESIIYKFRGGPVGLASLAASTAEEEGTIEEVYEPYLLQLGFLERTPRGRVATRLAWQHLGIPFPEQPNLLNS